MNGASARAQYRQTMAKLSDDNKQAELEEKERNRPPVACLGREGKCYIFYSTASRNITRLQPKEINWPNLLEIAPREHWERWLFPKETEAGAAPGKRELVAAAQERLLDESRCMLFNPESVRARGVWPDSADGWIYNAGSECWNIALDGSAPVQVPNVRAAHVYSIGNKLPAPGDTPLTDEEGAAIVQLLTARPWTMAGAGELLAGWTVASLLAGCTPMRPHIWINAPAGTGKTYLKNDIAALLGAFALCMEGIPTEAATRQRRKSDCLPVLLDEVEPGESKKNQKNIAALLELMRNASYEGKICKGTQDGTGTIFLMKCNFILFSIANDICRDADASRIVALRLERRNHTALSELWERQKAGRALIHSKDFQRRLITRLLSVLPVLMDNQKQLYAELINSGIDPRKAEIFSVLMACRHALTSRNQMTSHDVERAAGIVASYDAQDDQESDFSRCLTIILKHTVDIYGTGKRTVIDACKLADNASPDIKENVQAALNTIGLRWREDKAALQVDARADMMKRIYTGTQWSNGKIKAVLAEGCDYKTKAPNAAGIWLESARFTRCANPQSCIFIPRELME